jgi:muconate cycloisomerase
VDEYQELLAALLRGRHPADVQQMHRDFVEHFDVEGSSLAKQAGCALDMAMYDLLGKASGQAVHRLLGGAVRRDVEISWVAFIRDDLEAVGEEIRRKVAEGFRAFKLKVGADIELDEQRIALTRKIAGPGASIKIDANEGWSIDEAVANIRRLNRYDLAGVETPVPRENPADIAAVRRQVEVPILEHVSRLDYGFALLKAEAVDVFNVATTGAGGLWPARQIVTLAQSAGVGVLLGSTVELGPGTLAQLHLAATVPNLTLPSDLVGPGLYTHHVLAKPMRYRSGRLAVPTGPGLGADPDPDQLRRLRPAES